MGLTPEDLIKLDKPPQSKTEEEIPNFNIVKENASSNVLGSTSNSKPKDLKVTVNLESDTATVVSGAFNVITKLFDSYVPIITGAAVAASTAAITKSLPANQRLVGMIAAGAISSGTMLTSQYLKKLFNAEKYKADKSKIESSSILSKVDSLEVKPDWNKETNIQDMDITESSYFIDAPLEGYGDLSMVVLGLMIISFGVVLGLLVIVFNHLTLSLKLESRKFVTDRPLLLKFINYSIKGRKVVSNVMLAFVLFGACSMYYYLGCLLEYLRDNNL
ncbi:hypothetical protein INT48_007979 [Thamnidium elegans]|uniref:Transmembrane protein n=1 Tax=Thamnidium elegans TaxID=101142 RepID=A0A8H7SMG4_9FUNG|nr:hypothetical protein INT48_007979 [Thamnidium elegans]